MNNDDEARLVPRVPPDRRDDPRRADVFTSANADAPERERSVQERADAGEKVSVSDLAVHLGHVTVVRREEKLEASDGPTQLKLTPEYAAAAALHGWAQFEYDEGEPLELTKEDFEAALAFKTNEAGIPQPHEAAYVGKHDLEGDAAKTEAFEKAQDEHKRGAEAAKRAREARKAKRV